MEGFTATLLHAVGYHPGSFEVLAEGVGALGKPLQAIAPGLGNGRVFLAHIQTPQLDFHLRALPDSFALEGKLLSVQRIIAPAPPESQWRPAEQAAGPDTSPRRPVWGPPGPVLLPPSFPGLGVFPGDGGRGATSRGPSSLLPQGGI